MKKIVLLMIMISAITCGLYKNKKDDGVVKNINSNIVEITKEEKVDYKNKFILHAGGVTTDGITGSNSLEALENSYANGYRLIEIDFCWTEDDKLVCIHDWDAYYANRFNKKSLTINEFNEVKDKSYGYTSLNLDDLAKWIKNHKDILIVTDIKERNINGAQKIASKYPELKDNFCIQIYNKEEYNEILKLGFEKIILTVYQMTWEEKSNAEDIINFAEKNELMGITFPIELMEIIPNYLERLKKSNTSLYVHTVNDKEKQIELFESGISGIYTDFVEY